MPPLDISADVNFYISDWGETFTHINRRTGAENTFTGSFAEINTDEMSEEGLEHEHFDCAVTFKTADITIKKEDRIKRSSNGFTYVVYDLDPQGALTSVRASYKKREFIGGL